MKSILLLHGALGSKAQFAALTKELEQTKIVYSFNFESHGGSGAKGPFSIDSLVENVRDFMDQNKLDKIDLFGYSMGGYVALKYALKFPERIGKISTLGTKFDWTPESAANEIKRLNPELIELKVPVFAKLLKAEHHPDDWKELMNNTANMMLDLGNGSAMTEANFKEISSQVIICRGSNDEMVTKAESLKVVQYLQNADYFELENTPHALEKVELDKLVALCIEE